MFKIVNNDNSIGHYQMTKEVAKISAREILKQRSTQEQFKIIDPWYRSHVDQHEATKNAKIYHKNYERILPEKLSSETKNEMWKRAKQLKDTFVQGMLSRDELHPVKIFTQDGTTVCVVDEEQMRTNHSTERELAWQKNNESKVKEFKNLMRHLNPDDPNAGDIERYRPRKIVTVLKEIERR